MFGQLSAGLTASDLTMLQPPKAGRAAKAVPPPLKTGSEKHFAFRR